MKMRLVMAVALALTMATGGVAFADKPVTTRFASTKEVGTFRLDQTFHFSRTEMTTDNSLVPFDGEHLPTRGSLQNVATSGGNLRCRFIPFPSSGIALRIGRLYDSPVHAFVLRADFSYFNRVKVSEVVNF